MNLADNLKKIRKDNNLSQEQLAEKLGVSRQSVSKWESGLAYPEMDKVIQICKMFNLNMDELLNKDISEVKETKESKSRVNKFIDDFLEFITKTFNMFSSMKLKTKIKCIFEQIIIIVLLILMFLIFGSVLSFIVSRIFRGFDYIGAYYFIYNILEAFYVIFALIFGSVIFFHIFKVRYLDYYVVVKNKELDYVEDKEMEKVYLEKKPETIIIRDPKHSEYGFIKGLFKILLFLIKAVIIFSSFFLLFLLVLEVITFILSFVIIKSGLFFVGCLIALASSICLTLTILYMMYKIIFNKNINKSKIFISFISSIIFAGVGIGLTLVAFKDFTYISDLNSKYYIDDTYTLDMNDNLLIDDFHNVEFVESDTNNIDITCKHSKFYTFKIYNESENIYFNVFEKENFMEQLREGIKDFIDKKIIDYAKYKIYIKTSKENIAKLKENRRNFIELQNQRYNEELSYQNRIDELNDKLEEKQEKIYELEFELENKEIRISELEDTIKAYLDDN